MLTLRLYCDFLYHSFEFLVILGGGNTTSAFWLCREPPISEHPLVLLYGHRLPELCRRRPIKVETNHPHTCPV